MLNPKSTIYNLKSKIRKYLPLIVLISGFIIIPLLALSAIHGPNECCVLDHNLTEIDTNCAQGRVIASTKCTNALAVNSACIDQPAGGDPDAFFDECWVDKTSPPDGDYVDPEDIPCEEDWLECWCDADGDNFNEAPTTCAANAGLTLSGSKKWGTCCIVDAIYNVTDWVFYVLLIGVTLAVIIAGFLFLTSGGDTNKIKKAQDSLLYGIIALILTIMSKIIPAMIKALVS